MGVSEERLRESGLGSAGRLFFRAVGWTAGVALVVVLVLFIAVGLDFHFRNEAPDVGGIARSQAVVAADHVAASAISADLKTLVPTDAPWLATGPTAVADFCESTPGYMSGWQPTTCTRNVTAYFYFNGSFQQHMQAWDLALRSAGWDTNGSAMSRPLAEYAQFASTPAPGEPGRPQLATSLSPAGPYSRTVADSATPDEWVDLMLSWAERPQATPSFDGIDDSLPDPNAAVAWNQETNSSPDAVESAAFARYQFIAIARLSVRYYDPAQVAPTPTPSTNPAAGQCMSGSNTCN